MLRFCVAASNSGCSRHELVEMPREQDIVPDHLQIPGAAHLPQRQPHLQRPETPRVLRPVVEVVHDLIVEMVVGRVIRKGVAQLLSIANEHAAGFERRVEPLVGIDCDRVGLIERPQAVRRSRRQRRERAIGAVHVEPQFMFPADAGDLRKGIDDARADRPGSADDKKWLMAEAAIVLDLTSQERGVHSLLIVGRNPADGVGAEPEEIGSLLDPRVGFGRGVDEQLPSFAR